MPPKAPKAKKPSQAAEVQLSAEELELLKDKEIAKGLLRQSQLEERRFNEFQQQRERLNYFWIVEKKRLEDLRSDLRNKSRELEDLEEENHLEVKNEKKRLKYLLHEHQRALGQLEIDGERQVELNQIQHLKEILTSNEQQNHVLLKESQGHEDSRDRLYVSIKIMQDKRLTELRADFERRADEVQRIFENRIQYIRETRESERREELRRLESFKSRHVDNLIRQNEAELNDIRVYYSDITHNSLDLIKALKDEVKELELNDVKQTQKVNGKLAENQKSTQPLVKLKQQLSVYRIDVENYQARLRELDDVNHEVNDQETIVNHFKMEVLVLEQQFQLCAKELDELKFEWSRMIKQVSRSSSMAEIRNLMTFHEAKLVNDNLERQLHEILMDHGGSDDNQVAELNAELHELDANYESMLQESRGVLNKYRCRFDEIDFH